MSIRANPWLRRRGRVRDDLRRMPVLQRPQERVLARLANESSRPHDDQEILGTRQRHVEPPVVLVRLGRVQRGEVEDDGLAFVALEGIHGGRRGVDEAGELAVVRDTFAEALCLRAKRR